MSDNNWFEALFQTKAERVEMTEFHTIRGHYEDEQGLWTPGELDLQSGKGPAPGFGLVFQDEDGGRCTFAHTPTGFLITSTEAAWRFYPAAGELARIGMAGWVDRL